MTVEELVQHLSRGVFFLLLGITAYHYYIHRDTIRRDIFLVFLALSTGNAIRAVFSLFGAAPPPLVALVGQVALVAQPFLTIRLLTYFRTVPRWVLTSAVVILVVNWVALIFLAVAEETVSQSTLVSAFIAFNFAFFNGYAVWAFVSGAFSTAGVVSQRLRFTAAGSAFLAVVIGSAGVNLLFPALRPYTLPLLQFFSILAGISFYLGFAPPQWLRQAWQHSELRQYLQDSQQPDGSKNKIIDRLAQSVTRGLGTNVIAVKVALWDDTHERLVVHNSQEEQPAPPQNLLLSPTIEQAWEAQSPIVLQEKTIETAQDVKLLSLHHAKSMLAVPLATNEQSMGMLIVFLQHGSLFVDEDLALLQIFAQQAAIVLQNQRLVDQLYERNEDLEQKVKARTADLQRSNEELKMFAYVASHDLQEPLRTISSYLQLVESRYADKLDSDGHEFIAFAVDGAARMKELIQDVLMYSRVETQAKNFTVFSAQNAVDEVCKLLELSINEAQAIINYESLPEIKADRRLVIQLFQNLLGNAIKYRGDRKPEVKIGYTRENGNWHFSVKDNGIGIEPQYLDQIFVVFRRLHHRGTYSGTGIGLAICKKSVELHGGRIWVESTPGVGSTFHFTLPVEPIED